MGVRQIWLIQQPEDFREERENYTAKHYYDHGKVLGVFYIQYGDEEEKEENYL